MRISYMLLGGMAAIGASAWQQQIQAPSVTLARKTQPKAAARSAAFRLLDSKRTFGPLVIAGQRFFFVVHEKRVPGVAVPDPDLRQTVRAIEIRSASGRIQYQKKFPYELEDGRFLETLTVQPQILRGTRGTGLLVTYKVLPSSRVADQYQQIFGVIRGALVPFSKPFSIAGGRDSEPIGAVVRTSLTMNPAADALEFRVWTGNFFVIVPLSIDWTAGKMSSGSRCWKMTAQGAQGSCEFGVEVQRSPSPSTAEQQAVRLFSAPSESAATVTRVPIRGTSRVDFLAARASPVWAEEDERIDFGVSADLWLRVRIDNKQGWIHGEQDLRSVGLPTVR